MLSAIAVLSLSTTPVLSALMPSKRYNVDKPRRASARPCVRAYAGGILTVVAREVVDLATAQRAHFYVMGA